MEDHIIPECFFDTLLVKTLLKRKRVNHQKSCPKVISTVKSIDDFALGIIDKDKDEKKHEYLSEFNEEINNGNLILLKHRDKHHYFIQLVPAIESWILSAAAESNINIEDFGLPTELKKLRDQTKQQSVNENDQLRSLCRQLAESNGKTVSTLSSWLNYLFEHNRNADINILKQNV